MPELPEVETVRRSLLDVIVGRRIIALRAHAFTGVMGGTAVPDADMRLRGRLVTGIRRRGKYLFFDLDDDTTLLVHLRMTGQLVVTSRDSSPLRFEHLAIELDSGIDLRFADQRKFGRVLHLLPSDATALDARIGPEPLAAAFSSQELTRRLARRPGKLKNVLLDQRFVAGLGNIYVDEALHRARLHPERAANSLQAVEIRRLQRAIRSVLRAGIEHRGTTFSSFKDGEGRAGDNQQFLQVYGRGSKGEPCHRCGTPIHRIVVGGRGTHFCPRCQSAAPTPATAVH